MSPAPVHHIKAIVFDLDGVLVNSFSSWLQSYASVLKEGKRMPLSERTFRNEYWGYGVKRNLRKMDIPLSSTEFCQNIFPNFVSSISPVENAETVVEKISSQFLVGVITNIPSQCSRYITEKIPFHQYINAIVTADQVDHEKPSPDMIYHVCDQLGVEPGCTVLVGDTVIDMEAGRNAGCLTVGIGVGGDYSIDHVNLLPDLINRITQIVIESGEEYK